MIVKFIRKMWVLKVKMHLKTIDDFFNTSISNFAPLIIEKKIDTIKFKGLFDPSQLTLQRFTCIKC